MTRALRRHVGIRRPERVPQQRHETQAEASEGVHHQPEGEERAEGVEETPQRLEAPGGHPQQRHRQGRHRPDSQPGPLQPGQTDVQGRAPGEHGKEEERKGRGQPGQNDLVGEAEPPQQPGDVGQLDHRGAGNESREHQRQQPRVAVVRPQEKDQEPHHHEGDRVERDELDGQAPSEGLRLGGPEHELELEGAGLRLGRPLHGEPHRVARLPAQHEVEDGVRSAGALAVEGDDDVARAQTRRGRRAVLVDVLDVDRPRLPRVAGLVDSQPRLGLEANGVEPDPGVQERGHGEHPRERGQEPASAGRHGPILCRGADKLLAHSATCREGGRRGYSNRILPGPSLTSRTLTSVRILSRRASRPST